MIYKGHNYVKIVGGATRSLSAYGPLMICICIKFQKILQRVLELLSGTTLAYGNLQRHDSVKIVGGVAVLVLWTSSDNALHLIRVL